MNVATGIAPSIVASIERARSKCAVFKKKALNCPETIRKIILYGQLLPSIKSAADLPHSPALSPMNCQDRASAAQTSAARVAV